ncbi:polysaccharide deacetylase family protein [Streptomyces sp. SID12488]|uniref:polysaccharide deacetylase family protein n=1 Tax=Streptomyces sp. SID12488 TaxID=2706040 RepID=UPI0013DD1E45|nr:polysaccharide deacetylase family protein [Streptomyces sp. SID12488]NEA66797.1 polysaccharide deacetylase family protein [Streptomyces sp. SID12488]
MVRVTTTDRRAVLRAGAGIVASGVLTTGCATDTATGGTAAHPVAAFSSAPASHTPAPTPATLLHYPAQIAHGPRDHPQVALTFHGDGDPATAHALLAAAEKHGSHITVFTVGTWLDAHPGLARRVLDGGHELGNHTLRHLDINAMPEADADAEIRGCAERLKGLTGSIGTWFRPSRAALASPLVERLAQRAGYPHVLSYDVDSLDFTSPGAPAVVRNVMTGIRAGSIVSLHFGYADTVAAFPGLLHELDRRGLRAVTTTELLT